MIYKLIYRYSITNIYCLPSICWFCFFYF